MRFTLLSTLLLAPSLVLSQGAKAPQGVFEYVIQSSPATFEAATASIAAAATRSGWRIVANVASGAPKQCGYRSRVFVLVDSAHARNVMQANRATGPFAITDRVNLFEDERGLHVAIVNPRSINRTVLMDDAKFEAMTAAHVQALRTMIATAVPGTPSAQQFGEMRDQGFISRTMGVMAGGKFSDKLGDDAVVPGGEWKAVAAKVQQGLAAPGPRWGMHMAYAYELSEFQTMVFGTTGTPMDVTSFDIVKSGGDATRSRYKCAGLDHAAAYPLEIVVVQEGSVVRVRQVDAMYRMKMYFEDAGKLAFMKNMTMPGSIHDELKTQILAGLGASK